MCFCSLGTFQRMRVGMEITSDTNQANKLILTNNQGETQNPAIFNDNVNNHKNKH